MYIVQSSKIKVCTIALLAITILAACTSPKEHRRMEVMLDDYEQRNSSYDTLLTDSVRLLTEFFDRHGSRSQRMRAWYLLGCAHDCAGESPQALDCFYKAVDFADTTSKDCDYKRLSRIHGQIATILLQQHALDDALKEMDSIDKYAFLSKDTFMRVLNVDKKASVYRKKGNLDSAFALHERAYQQFKQYGMEKASSSVAASMVDILLDKGNLKKAKEYIDEYEFKSGFFDSTHTLVHPNKTFYYMKGRYYMALALLDSAAYYFRKEIKESTLTNNLESGYLGLSQYFLQKHMPDSAAKYALLSREMNDSCYNELSTDYYQRMQAAYNYSRMQKKKTIIERENSKMKAALVLASVLLIFALMLSFIVYLIYKKKRQMSQRMVFEWREKYDELMQARNEMAALSKTENEGIQDVILNKKEQLEQLENQISVLQRQKHLMRVSYTEEKLLDASIVRLFKNSVVDRNIMVGADQWHQLRIHVAKYLPTFIKTIENYGPSITETEMRVCILVRLHFPLKDIALLENITLPHLGIMRKRLLKKMFGIDGSAKEFDKKILQMA